MKTPRVRMGLGLATIAIVLAWTLFRPEAVFVELAVVERGPLSVTIDEDGITRFRRHGTVSAPITGRLLDISLRPGDSVRRGEVVARLLPAPLDERSREQAEANASAAQAARAQADALVRQAEVLLDQAGRDRLRAERLGAAGAVAPKIVEDAIANEQVRQRELEKARAAREGAVQSERQARLALLGTNPTGDAGAIAVRSPLDGVVLRLMEEHERVVPAGAPLLEVGDAGAVDLEVDVLSSDAARIVIGAPISVRVAGGLDLAGRVTRVEPAAFTRISPLGVEEQRVNVIGRFVDPPIGLGDGYRVAVSIELWRAASVVRVPANSLVPAGEGWGVFVVDGGRARLRALDLGHQGTGAVEVTRGVEGGEVIILYPDERIADGTRVKER